MRARLSRKGIRLNKAERGFSLHTLEDSNYSSQFYGVLVTWYAFNIVIVLKTVPKRFLYLEFI